MKKHNLKSEFEYIESLNGKLEKYVGNWISVVGEEIVDAGPDAQAVYDKAKKKYPDRTPFIMKIPKETDMLL